MSMPIDPNYRPGFNNCDEVNALCPVEASTYGEFFNLGGCIFFTVFYAIALIWTTYIGIKGRTWTFSIFLAIGIILELMGYAARIAMSPIGTVWNYSAFVIQLVMLIIGPTLVAAAISVTFKWIVIHKGIKYSVMRPSLYPWFFVGLDFFSIVIQAIGGAISATATGGETNAKLLDVGSDLLVAGVAFQAANMAFCGMFMVIYWWRYRRASKRGELEPPKDTTLVNGDTPSGSTTPEQTQPQTAREENRFKLFIWALLIAYLAVLVRCIYRIPEMALGWGSTLMQNETLFLILDGAMVAIAVLCLSVFHPAIFFPILSKPKRSKDTTETKRRRSLFKKEKTTEEN